MSMDPGMKFDFVISSFFLNVFPDERTAARVLERVRPFIRKGGRILIADEMDPTDPVLHIIVGMSRVPVFLLFQIITGQRFHRIFDLPALLRQEGYSDIEEVRFLYQYCSVITGKV
jgi:hypothetical protein